MQRQGVLPLSLPTVYAADNFYVSACNRNAHAWIMRWPDWPGNALVLYGPSGSGKTHLGHIWALRAKAAIVNGRDGFLPETLHGDTLIEDIGDIRDPRMLLHAINYLREQKASLLLTSALPPKQLPFTLPDLTSRILAMPSISIEPPDDDAMAAAIRKQFSDRQLKVDDEAIAFLLPRLERSFAQIATTVEALDHEALAEQRNLTIPFIRKVLGY